MGKKESVVNVPLKPEVKRLLERQADVNGRAMGREAARLQERGESRCTWRRRT